MKIDKETIISLLTKQGRQDDVADAAKALPDEVDTERDRGLLSKYGIDVDELLDRLPGGLGDKLDELPGGLGKKLDDLL